MKHRVGARERTLRRERQWRVEVFRQRVAFWEIVWRVFRDCRREGKPQWLRIGFGRETLPDQRTVLDEFDKARLSSLLCP